MNANVIVQECMDMDTCANIVYIYCLYFSLRSPYTHTQTLTHTHTHTRKQNRNVETERREKKQKRLLSLTRFSVECHRVKTENRVHVHRTCECTHMYI